MKNKFQKQFMKIFYDKIAGEKCEYSAPIADVGEYVLHCQRKLFVNRNY